MYVRTYHRTSLSWPNLTLNTHPIIYLIPLAIPSHDSVYLILGLPTHALKTGKSDCGPARALQSQPPLWTDSLAPVRFVIDRYSICNTMWFESWRADQRADNMMPVGTVPTTLPRLSVEVSLETFRIAMLIIIAFSHGCDKGRVKSYSNWFR